MRLTRRDALAVLGVTAGVGGATVAADVATDGAVREAVLGETSERDPLPAATRATMTAAAELLYPSEAEGIASFVDSYARGRLAADPERRPDVIEAATELNDAAEAFHDESFDALAPKRRDDTLRSLGVADADPDPDGTVPERIRYYVVNDLLYAFYASPAGGELVGTSNPIGYPGGYRTALSPDNRRADPDEPTDPTASVPDEPIDDTRTANDSTNSADDTRTANDSANSADDTRIVDGQTDSADDTRIVDGQTDSADDTPTSGESGGVSDG